MSRMMIFILEWLVSPIVLTKLRVEAVSTCYLLIILPALKVSLQKYVIHMIAYIFENFESIKIFSENIFSVICIDNI